MTFESSLNVSVFLLTLLRFVCSVYLTSKRKSEVKETKRMYVEWVVNRSVRIDSYNSNSLFNRIFFSSKY